MSDETFLSRWSRKKHEAHRDEPAAESKPLPPQPAPEAAAPIAMPAEPAPLPDVASLTPESDFTPFMRGDVDPALKREALKTLFSDPRFNVMDGLDVYIDDYSKPDPLPEGWLEKLEQVKHLGIFRDPEEASTEAAAPQSQSPGMPRAETQPGALPEAPFAPEEPPIPLETIRKSERSDE